MPVKEPYYHPHLQLCDKPSLESYTWRHLKVLLHLTWHDPFLMRITSTQYTPLNKFIRKGFINMNYSFTCYFIKQYIHFINTNLCEDKFHRLMMQYLSAGWFLTASTCSRRFWRMFPKRKPYLGTLSRHSTEDAVTLIMVLLGNQRVIAQLKLLVTLLSLPTLDYKWNSGYVAVAAKFAYNERLNYTVLGSELLCHECHHNVARSHSDLITVYWWHGDKVCNSLISYYYLHFCTIILYISRELLSPSTCGSFAGGTEWVYTEIKNMERLSIELSQNCVKSNTEVIILDTVCAVSVYINTAKFSDWIASTFYNQSYRTLEDTSGIRRFFIFCILYYEIQHLLCD